MRTALLSLLAAGAVAGLPTVAAAQTWMSLDQRRAGFDQHIAAAVRGGHIEASEASRRHAELQDLVHLETFYRANGLTEWERQDLDFRYDSLVGRLGPSWDIEVAALTATAAEASTTTPAGVELVTNGPVPDTPATRSLYPPLSRAGRMTAPLGN